MTKTISLMFLGLEILFIDGALVNKTECGKNISNGCCANHFRNKDGVCQVCANGWFGVQCKEICPTGYYGYICLSKCNCTDNLCHNVNGCLSDDDDESTQKWIMVTFFLIGSLSTIAIIAFFIYAKSCVARDRKIDISEVRNDANFDTNPGGSEMDEDNENLQHDVDNSSLEDGVENLQTDVGYSAFNFGEDCCASGGIKLPYIPFVGQSCSCSKSEDNVEDDTVGYEELNNNYNYNILSLRKNVNVTYIPSYSPTSVNNNSVMSPIYCVNDDYTIVTRNVETLPRMTPLNKEENDKRRPYSLAVYSVPVKSRCTTECPEFPPLTSSKLCSQTAETSFEEEGMTPLNKEENDKRRPYSLAVYSVPVKSRCTTECPEFPSPTSSKSCSQTAEIDFEGQSP